MLEEYSTQNSQLLQQIEELKEENMRLRHSTY